MSADSDREGDSERAMGRAWAVKKLLFLVMLLEVNLVLILSRGATTVPVSAIAPAGNAEKDFYIANSSLFSGTARAVRSR